MGAEARIKELGIELPTPSSPVANYVKYVRTGNLLFLSGHGPSDSIPRGKLGAELTIEQGYAAARDVGISMIATLKMALGDLDKVKRVVKILGMVNSTPDFGDQPKVMNGCSDLMVDVFGEAGRHSRSAVGFVALPNQIPVEIEATFEVE
jgi:enamine deaminase RidA (YjgF/YER057c/UK114 family)